MVEVCLENGLLLSLLKFILPTSPLRNGITMVTSLPFFFYFILFYFIYLINLFIYGCVGSSFLCEGFL